MIARMSTPLTLCLVVGLASIGVPALAVEPYVHVTQWGTQGTAYWQFQGPSGVAVQGGDVYVADAGNYRIKKFTTDGAYVSQWNVSNPQRIAIRGYLYVTHGNTVATYTPEGTLVTLWGPIGFSIPQGVTTDGNGNVFISDVGYQRVRKYSPSGTFLLEWGSSGNGPGQFSNPGQVATDADGNVYVSDPGNHRIQKFTSSGAFLTQWGGLGTGDGQMNLPDGIAIDNQGHVFVADSRNHRIQMFTENGDFLAKWGSLGTLPGQFNYPYSLAVDATGALYVTELGNHRIQKFAPPPDPPVAMRFDFSPKTLNLAAGGLWVTGYLEPPPPLAAADIDIESILLNDVVAVDPNAPTEIGDHDLNGIPDRMVKFNRVQVENTVWEGIEERVVVSGSIGPLDFVGDDTIRVIRAHISSPTSASQFTAGAPAEVVWETPEGVTVESMALLQSFDGGESWSLAAHGQPNTGQFAFTVPNVPTPRAKLAVVLVESGDESGLIVDAVLGVSPSFVIQGTAGVVDANPTLALRLEGPNPARGVVRIGFRVEEHAPARLSLYDVGGRQVETRRVDGVGGGWQSIRLGGDDALAAGLYFVRLTQNGRVLTSRAVVTR